MDRLRSTRSESRRPARRLLGTGALSLGLLLAACSADTAGRTPAAQDKTTATTEATKPKQTPKLSLESGPQSVAESTTTKHKRGQTVEFLTFDPLIDPAKTKIYSTAADADPNQPIDAGKDKFYIDNPIFVGYTEETESMPTGLYFVDRAGQGAYIPFKGNTIQDKEGRELTADVINQTRVDGLIGDITGDGFNITEVINDSTVGAHPISGNMGSVYKAAA